MPIHRNATAQPTDRRDPHLAVLAAAAIIEAHAERGGYRAG